MTSTNLVSDQHHRHAVTRQPIEHPDHLADQLRVEGGGDLVEQHQARLHRQRPGDGDALLLPAGKLLRVGGDLVLEIDHPEDLAGERLRRRELHAFGRRRAERDVAFDRKMGKEIVALEDDADLAAQRLEALGRRLERLSVELDLAAIWPLEAVDAAEQRTLARAAAADDGDDLAGLDRERHIGERLMGAEPLRNVS